MKKNAPNYPIYIVSKGRWESRLTSKALEEMNVPYYIVVEEQEYSQYASVIDKRKILVLDKAYQRDYDTCDNLGDAKSKGPGAARNFVWEYSIKNGFKWHWVLDDNINGFVRLNRNKKIKVLSGAIFRAAEDFVSRYENIAIAGFNYRFFGGGQRVKQAPYILNTRIYSCLLIRNDIPYRWRARYNEDTDLSLRALKDGWCTVLFQAFLCNKIRTMMLKGGNSDAFYFKEGTLPKSEMLVNLHPDVTRIVWKFQRWHHHVDYSQFKDQQLILKTGIEIPRGIDNYGMILVTNDDKQVKMISKST